jgi:hypothetical protein
MLFYLGVVVLTLIAIPLAQARPNDHAPRPQYADWKDPQAARHTPLF